MIAQFILLIMGSHQSHGMESNSDNLKIPVGVYEIVAAFQNNVSLEQHVGRVVQIFSCQQLTLYPFRKSGIQHFQISEKFTNKDTTKLFVGDNSILDEIVYESETPLLIIWKAINAGKKSYVILANKEMNKFSGHIWLEKMKSLTKQPYLQRLKKLDNELYDHRFWFNKLPQNKNAENIFAQQLKGPLISKIDYELHENAEEKYLGNLLDDDENPDFPQLKVNLNKKMVASSNWNGKREWTKYN